MQWRAARAPRCTTAWDCQGERGEGEEAWGWRERREKEGEEATDTAADAGGAEGEEEEKEADDGAAEVAAEGEGEVSGEGEAAEETKEVEEEVDEEGWDVVFMKERPEDIQKLDSFEWPETEEDGENMPLKYGSQPTNLNPLSPAAHHHTAAHRLPLTIHHYLFPNISNPDTYRGTGAIVAGAVAKAMRASTSNGSILA